MMESIGDIIKRLPQLKVTGAPAPEVPAAVCPVCLGTGYVRRRESYEVMPCSCAVQETMQRYLTRLPDMTFDNFHQAPHLAGAYNAAWSMAEGLSDKRWLVMLGKPGLGKTHLAVAILRHRAMQGEGGRFEVVPDLLGWLRAGIGQEFGLEERLESVKTCPLLVLDDLGREKGTEWAEQIIYQVLDYRYRSRLETIVTSNLPLAGLAEPLRDRLEDKRLCEVVLLQGESYRSGTRYG